MEKLKYKENDKKAFSLDFQPYLTANRAGIQFSPIYNVNIGQFLNEEDLGKQFRVYFDIVSLYASNANLDAAAVYGINFNFGGNKIESICSDNLGAQMHSLLFLDIYMVNSTTPNYRFNSGMKNNPPLVINNLKLFNNISWTIYQNPVGSPITIFNASDNATVNAAVQYSLKLYFEEV